jgi:integrase
MARNRGFTETSIQALPLARGERYEVADITTPNLFIRVGKKKKVFIYVARVAGAKAPTRRTIGHFPLMSIDEAREIALQWSVELAKGLDPKVERKAAEIEVLMEPRRTFKSVVEDFIAALPSRERNRHVPQDINVIRREFLDPTRNTWLEKPIAEVTDFDISTLIGAIRDRPARRQAFICFGLFRAFFSWAMSPERRHHYGLIIDPIEKVKPSQLALIKQARTFLPDTYHIRAYWRAADETPYPYGPFFKGILLTGAVRKGELAGARWSEFDLKLKLWTVPKSRVKNGKQQPEHLVPLTEEMISLLEDIRRSQGPNHGEYVFSATNGQKPVNGFSKAMSALRLRMQAIMLEIKPDAKYSHMTLHDTRRIVRSALSALDVPSVIAETIIGHGRKGIEGVYDQYKFLPQIRTALNRFTKRLKEVLDGSADDFAFDSILNTEATANAGDNGR